MKGSKKHKFSGLDLGLDWVLAASSFDDAGDKCSVSSKP